MDKSSLPKKVALALALTHLLIMAAGAAHVPVAAVPIVGAPLAHYAEISGAGYNYGFFADGVFSQFRTVIEIRDRDGRQATEYLGQGPNREVDLRFNDIVETFMEEFNDPMRFQRSLAASFAGSVFARRPDAEKVRIRVERLSATPRTSYLEGQSSSWTTLYSALFIHNPAESKK